MHVLVIGSDARARTSVPVARGERRLLIRFVGRDVGGFVLLRKTELTVQIWTHLYDIYILITICEFRTDSLNWVRPDLVRGCTVTGTQSNMRLCLIPKQALGDDKQVTGNQNGPLRLERERERYKRQVGRPHSHE